MRAFRTPESVNVDAYQSGHFEMIPPGMENFQLSHGIFRKPLHYGGDEQADMRLLAGGVAPFLKLERGFAEPMTQWDIDEGEEFYNDFNLGGPYPWPKEMFERILGEYGGYYPVCIMALLDGQAHYVGEPHIQIWTDAPGMGECVGWIESTILPYLWNFSIVATRGRIRKERMIEVFQKAYPSKSLDVIHGMVATKFHDFGRRGGAASQMTGIAHLYNWVGTDVNDAAYAAYKYLNDGEKFGACSIPAAAHRTVTPWPTEDEAYDRMIRLFDKGYPVIAVVADSYGFSQGIRKLAGFADIVKTKNGFLVGRPDSGDPVECVVEGLRVFGDAFGTTEQEIGLKVINNAAIIQGDGISDKMIFNNIYPAVIANRFCPSNVAFGMGEYNHRAVRSDTEHGYKIAMVGIKDERYPDGYRESMKSSENYWKRSVPGAVTMNDKPGQVRNRVCSITLEELKAGKTGALKVMYDGRKNPLPVVRETFNQTRDRCWRTWLALPGAVGDTYAPALRRKQEKYLAKMQ